MNISRKLRIAVPVYSMEGYVNYFNAFEHMGVQGVLADSPTAFAECDGLLLPGGWDVEPSRYGQANTASEGVDLALDALQFGALERFIQSGRPVLGICRGHQLLNVAFGGSLIQHLPGHTKAKGETLDLIHPIRSVPGSWIDALYGAEAVVNSSHHQVVDRLGDGLSADAHALDGVVEALHHQCLPVWGVQWHPERLCFDKRRPDTTDGQWVLKVFLDACAEG